MPSTFPATTGLGQIERWPRPQAARPATFAANDVMPPYQGLSGIRPNFALQLPRGAALARYLSLANFAPAVFYGGLAELHSGLFLQAEQLLRFAEFDLVCQTAKVGQSGHMTACYSDGYSSTGNFGGPVCGDNWSTIGVFQPCYAPNLTPGSAQAQTIIRQQFQSNGTYLDRQIYEHWTSKNGGLADTHQLPATSATWAPPLEVPLPGLSPFAWPPGSPLPFPTPAPFRSLPDFQPNPWIDPAHQPGPGHNPVPRPVPITRPAPVTRPIGRPHPDITIWPHPQPGQPPILEVILEPTAGPGTSPGPRPRPRPGPRPRPEPGSNPGGTRPARPPGRGTKETNKKPGGKGAGKAMKALMKAANAATETLDVVTAAWKAFGAAGGWQTLVPGQQTTPQQMIEDIVTGWNDPHFNGAEFLLHFAANLAINEAGDRLVAAQGTVVRDASAQNPFMQHSWRGYGLGPAL